MSDYHKLKVWDKAHTMVLDTIKVALTIRSADFRSLRGQLIRAALSVPTNIVEGGGQKSSRERIRYLRYSENSSNEADYHCRVARDLGLIGARDYQRISGELEEVRRMLSGLIKRIERDGDKRQEYRDSTKVESLDPES